MSEKQTSKQYHLNVIVIIFMRMTFIQHSMLQGNGVIFHLPIVYIAIK